MALLTKEFPLLQPWQWRFRKITKSIIHFCFNRKEIKDHGEGGITFGAEINGRVLIIDDVISAGTSIRESMDIISTNGGDTVGAVVAVDRQERGLGEQSAIQEVEQVHKIKVISIISLEHIMTYLAEHGEMQAHLDAINAYEKAIWCG